jgi:hypothetical protein
VQQAFSEDEEGVGGAELEEGPGQAGEEEEERGEARLAGAGKAVAVETGGGGLAERCAVLLQGAEGEGRHAGEVGGEGHWVHAVEVKPGQVLVED